MSAGYIDRPKATAAACDTATRITRSLLGYGALAGPFYVLVVLGQALTRPGFDFLHDDVSLLSNGSLGWIQIANFLATGVMVIAFAMGVRRALAGGGRSATWAPILLAVYGLGLIGAGIFVADPMSGFPPGTAPGRPAVISTHGILHIAFAGIGFLGLVAACFVLARRFAREHRSAWSRFSLATGIAFLTGFAAVASGSSSAVVVLAFWAALIVAWAWMGMLAVHLYREVSEQSR